jgi:acyl-CoA synthetase (AMP-forming)/AMP-acid ligase II
MSVLDRSFPAAAVPEVLPAVILAALLAVRPQRHHGRRGAISLGHRGAHCPFHRARADAEQIVERRAAELPDAPAFCTAPQGSDQYTVITYRQFSLAADRLAQQYEQTPLNPEHLQPRVVGVISQTGLPFALLEIALLSLGLTALLLSPNNSVAALAHLLTITGSQHLLYHERYARQAEETRLLFEQQGKPPLCIVQEIPLILDAATDWSTFKPRPRIMSYDDESKRMAVIMHSSGSTGFPKPLPATHAATAALATFHFGLAGMLTTPIYHAHGHNAFFRTIHAAQPQAIFPAHLPFTSSAIKQAITAFERVMAPTHPALLAHTHFYAVPYNLKLLAEDEATVSELARFDTVTFAGSAMPEQLGQKLVEAGVPLVGVYGCSETGAVRAMPPRGPAPS